MNSTKCTYLDGVQFAINPVFIINDESNSKSDKKKKSNNSNDFLLNYDFNKAYSLLNSKYDYLTEASVLLLNKKSAKSKKKIAPSSRNEETSNGPENANIVINNNKNQLNNHQNYMLNEQNSNHLKTSQSLNNMTQAHPKPFFPSTPLYPFQILEPSKNVNLSNSNDPQKNSATSTTNNSANLNLNNNNLIKKDLLNNFDLSISTPSLDPFNDMELKTLNDLEELKTILHNHQLEQQFKQSMKLNSDCDNFATTSNNSNANLILNGSNNNENNNKCSSINSNGSSSDYDNFGLPKISFVDFDINSNKLK